MKKIVDEKGRLFGKLNLIDTVAIIVVLLLVIGVCMRFFVLDSTSVNTETTPITYSVQASGVRMYTIDAIEVGDTVYDDDTGTMVGVISAIDYAPAAQVDMAQDKDYFYGTSDQYYDLTITLDADGTVTNGRTYLNKTYELNVNSSRELHTKYCAFSVKISEIG
ncbi:MAG: DUF4330 domain-containing protein [Oscillospiraceae bacterium]|nr:DUF4330 domain-containing protein [Oscillospiraceae bacterium]